jgi:uncharacterized protein (DUF885 family)
MRAFALVLFVACSSPAPHKPSTPPNSDAELDAQIDGFMAGYFAFRPNAAIDVGLHDYDGKVPDRSRAAIDAEIGRLKTARLAFTAFDDGRLSERARVDRAVVLAEIAKELFDLETRRRPYRDPFYYLFKFSLNSYISRDYAPIEQRAGGMLRACEAAPAYYQQAVANLEPNLPRTWLQMSIGISGGFVGFLSGDAKRALATLSDPALKAKLEACLDNLAKEVGALGDALKARMPAATDDFRLGADTFLAMLREQEGLEVDLATLEKMGKADLERNRAALAAAAAQIDPKRDVAAVIAEVSNDKPDADKVISEATGQLEMLRKFIVDKQIISLPRPDRVEVRESPPFMRGNFAAFSGVGAFESKPLPGYYYIAPPDPTWPPEQQKGYILSRPDLLFTSAHEVYPGHFVTGMHQRAFGSRMLRTFETYTSSEGWAHYVEEMMWDAGLGDHDPRMHIGMLKNALLRDVRFLVALGYHTGTMTVEEATKLFVEQAFADGKTASQQAMRGTVDPMFLGYTLGKLLIMELRRDWQKQNPGKSLREFHDAFLKFGETPLPVVRKMMLQSPSAAPPPR